MRNKMFILILGFSLLIFSTVGCVPRTKPVCRHYALLSAITYQDIEKVPTRLVVGISVIDLTKGHVQAQAYINNEWKWIKFKNNKIQISEQDKFVAYRYMDINTYLRRVFYDSVFKPVQEPSGIEK